MAGILVNSNNRTNTKKSYTTINKGYETMKTPSQIEKALKAANLQLIKNNHNTNNITELAHARYIYKFVAGNHNIQSPGKLLSESISKLNKNSLPTFGLALLPATYSELGNLCAFSDSCANTCVAFSGNGSFNSTMRSRQTKTHLLINYPESFLVILKYEIEQIARKYGTAQIRLNTYSDIRWENIMPEIFAQYPEIQFYDYTKHPVSSRPALPENYKLTYSVSEKTTAKEIEKAKTANRNLAVVVSVRSGKIKDKWRPIKATWAGIPTVDGDQTDDRYSDPSGVVVILRRKYTMKPSHPMIQKAERLDQ
jgi:hypothetical protein